MTTFDWIIVGILGAFDVVLYTLLIMYMWYERHG